MFKKMLFGFVVVVMGVLGISFISMPVYAEACTCPDGSEGVKTAILGDGCSCDNGGGSGIMDILNLVVDIMTIGVGVLGVVGISVVGIQYLTAGGNEEKTRTAKRRMNEIIIGLAIYAVLFAILKWLNVAPS